MNVPFFGRCDTCAALLVGRYHSFNRKIEKRRYCSADDAGPVKIFIDVLMAEHLTLYCGEECAQIGAYCQLKERGIPFDTVVGKGPIASCTKCGIPMDLNLAHVAYELLDQTETRQPWLTSIEPNDSMTVALVCSSCEVNQSTDTDAQETDVPEQSTIQAVENRRLEFLK